jgi:hypothetical protein
MTVEITNVMDNVYDTLMENTIFLDFNFVDKFPESWYDNDNQTIYLAKNVGVALFKLKIERV